MFGEFFNSLNEFMGVDLVVHSTEVFKVKKGQFNHTTTLKYNKEGFYLGSETKSESILTKEEQLTELKQQLSQAVTAENFLEAAEIKKKIDKLKD